jgi:hypothetical protein
MVDIFVPRHDSHVLGQGLLSVEASRSLSDTPQLVGLLWTSDQPDTETPTWHHITQETDIYAPGGIRTRSPSRRAAADPRHRPNGHWGRHIVDTESPKNLCFAAINYKIISVSLIAPIILDLRFYLAQDRIQWRVLVNMIIKSRFPHKARNVWTSWYTYKKKVTYHSHTNFAWLKALCCSPDAMMSTDVKMNFSIKIFHLKNLTSVACISLKIQDNL